MSRYITCFSILLQMFILSSGSAAATLESFLEPHKQVDIVPVNRDIVREVHVAEGDLVKVGQLMVTLDLGVLNAQHNTAKILASNRGQLDSAKIIVAMRKAQLENLTRLRSAVISSMKSLPRDQISVLESMARSLTISG